MDAELIANYRVPAELSSIETTEDGNSVILGTVDGCLTVLVIADLAKTQMQTYLQALPSRNEEVRYLTYPSPSLPYMAAPHLRIKPCKYKSFEE